MVTPEDKLAILDLALRHDRAIEERRLDAWLGTWAPEGVLEGPFGTYRGSALRGFAESYLEAGRPRRHLTTRHVVRAEGAAVRMLSEFLVAEGATTPKVVATGSYEDDLVRCDGEWRFARRRLLVDPAWFLSAPSVVLEPAAAARP